MTDQVYIERLIVKGYKILEDVNIELNQKMNIFIGENDSGKSSILEAIQIATRGRLGRLSIDSIISPDIFSKKNRDTYIEALKSKKADIELPEIVIEVYFNNCQDTAFLFGTNNSLYLNYPGIRVKVEFDSTYTSLYQSLVCNGQVKDIPVEYYKVSKNYFSGDPVNYRTPLFRVEILNTYQHDYSNSADRYISSTLDSFLTENDKVVIKGAYNQALANFRNDEGVASLIGNIRLESLESNNFGNAEVRAKNDVLQSIGEKLEIILKDIPLAYSGTGTQNLVKAALYLNSKSTVQALLIEEPENNLSFSNMHKLVEIIQRGNEQIFITTHSSYITNHLGLNYVHLIAHGICTSFDGLQSDDVRFFEKLSGYDTLRFILSSKVILVEGPSDELVLAKAYCDINGITPQEDGVDIIAVGGLVFKRYCSLAKKLNKKVVIVTDNDGDTAKLEERYSDILQTPNLFQLFYDHDNSLRTLEPTILAANSEETELYEVFKSIVSPNKDRSKEEILSYMISNKTEWAMKLLHTGCKIQYPQYITDAVTWWREHGE